MNKFIHGRLGHFLQNEAGADGGDAGGGPAADATPAPTPETSSLLGAEPAKEPAKADPAPTTDAAVESKEKPEEGKDPEKKEQGAEKKDDQAEGAPESYEAFTVPEGIEIAEEVMPDVQELFKDLNLPQAKAQEVFEKLLGLQERINGTPEQQMQRAEENIIALNTSLAEQCKQLPDIGGERFGESLATASKVMQQFGTPELRSLIALTGVGSHPEFFKMMVAIGSKMSPDTFEQGGETPQADRRAADVMFGDLFQKS